MFNSRVTIFVGHFGSGKTEIAVNGALQLAGSGVAVALVDLDVVKPYFRSRSAREFMAEKGIDVVIPTGENVHADLPIIVPRIRALLAKSARKVLVDAGGDPTGARALGSLSDAIPVDETEHLLVLNFRRPFTQTVDEAVGMVHEVEAAARIPVTGLVSNTHLLGETTSEIVTAGFEMARETGERLGLPVVAIAVDDVTRPRIAANAFPCEILTLHRLIKPPFESRRGPAKHGPLFVLN